MKYYLKISLSFLLLFMGCVPAGAQTFPSNTIKFGDGANTDKKITANKGSGAANPQLKYNATAGSWQFSSDGTNFSDFGSGSGAGGGLNLITKNPDFEQGATNGWTNSGGTYAAVSSGSNLLFGKGSVTFTASSGGNYVQSDLYSIPEGLAGKSCLGRIYYKGGSTNLTVKVLDSSSNLIASRALEAASSIALPHTVAFLCPAAGTQIRLRVEATASSAIVALDRMHLGEEDRLFQFSQAQLIGTLKYPAAANCRWQLSVSSFTDYPVDSDCASPVVTGGLLPNDGGKVPGFKLANVKPGGYMIVALGSFRHFSASGNWPMMRFTDGIQFTQEQGIETGTSGTNSGTVPMVSGLLTYSSAQQNVNVKMQGGANAGTQSSEIYNEATGTEFQVYYFPSAPQTGFLPETNAWRGEAAISGSVGLSLSTQPTPIEMSQNGLTMNNAPIANAVPFQIACDGTNPSTGTTCSGNESNGIAFDLPAAGDVEICVGGTSVISNASSGVDGTFFLVETPNNAQTVLQTGYGQIRFGNGTAAGHITHEPFRICSTLSFATAGKKTVRMMYSQSAGGLSSSSIESIHWSAAPVSQKVPAPVLVQKPKVKGYYDGIPSGTLSGSYNLTTYPNVLNEFPSGISSGGIVTIPETGKYDISASFAIVSGTGAAGDYVSIGIFLNGTTQIGTYSARWVVAGGNGSVTTPVNLKAYPLNAGDTIQIKATTSASGASYGSMLSSSESFFSLLKVED